MYSNILIPVAPGHSNDVGTAVELAKLLANDGAVITALSIVEEVPHYAGAYVPMEFTKNHLAETERELETTFAGKGIQTETTLGHASTGILDWAKAHEADCIIVSSHRPEFSDWFLGSTAARVVRHAECPVVVLR